MTKAPKTRARAPSVQAQTVAHCRRTIWRSSRALHHHTIAVCKSCISACSWRLSGLPKWEGRPARDTKTKESSIEQQKHPHVISYLRQSRTSMVASTLSLFHMKLILMVWVDEHHMLHVTFALR